jgi:beta-galactosidase
MLSGHDEWVELYKSRSLDIRKAPLTLSLWVKPTRWTGVGSFITKGDGQFGLIQSDEDRLEFYIVDYARIGVKTRIPDDWYQSWHYLAGVYDGQELKLFVDGEMAASRRYRGKISNSAYPVNIGRNAQLHGQNFSGPISAAVVDEVRILRRALSEDEVHAEFSQPSGAVDPDAVLWLDFEDFEDKGEFYSIGIGARTYGLVWPDRTVQPELWQVKKTPQPVLIEEIDLAEGRFRVTNRFNFTNLSLLGGSWALMVDGKKDREGSFLMDLNPGESSILELPARGTRRGSGVEHLTISFSLASEQPWAPRGHEVAWEQFRYPERSRRESLVLAGMPELAVSDSAEGTRIRGEDFEVGFGKSGSLTSLTFEGRELLERGPALNLWRAPTANEQDEWRNPPIAPVWSGAGLDSLRHYPKETEVKRISPQHVVVRSSFDVTTEDSPVHFPTEYRYDVFGSGDVTVSVRVVSAGQFPDWTPQIVMWLPKVGLQMDVPDEFGTLTWLGRGPFETYPDRKSGAKLGLYSSSVWDEYLPYLIPQDYGNKTDVEWAVLSDPSGVGMFLAASTPFNLSVHEYSTENLTRGLYPFQLQSRDSITVNLDHQVTGVGGTPIPTLKEYRVMPRIYEFSVRLRPFSSKEETPEQLSRQDLPN